MSRRKRILIAILAVPLTCILAYGVLVIDCLANLPVDDGPGHEGTSVAAPIVIHASDEFTGVRIETVWVSVHRPTYTIMSQGVMNSGDSMYDVLEIVSPDGKTSTLYFDISEFYGKW
jgi:hypothetical protein